MSSPSRDVPALDARACAPVSASVRESIDVLDRDAAHANRQLGLSIVADGHQVVASAALAAAGDAAVSVTTRGVAGVPIVEVQSTPVARAYSLTARSRMSSSKTWARRRVTPRRRC